jgi:hypothetical protein
VTRSDERRLDKIAAALTPKQAFLLWLDAAQQHESWAAHVLAMRGQPIAQHPYQRLPRQVEQAVRGAHQAQRAAPANPFAGPAGQRAQRERQLEQEVVTAVREVAFYLELHGALTDRLAVEWKALTLQLLLALGECRALWRQDAPAPRELYRARSWVVQAAGELLGWQAVATRLADQYTSGRRLLFPEQARLLTESIEIAMLLVEQFNDHLGWLAYLRDDAKKRKVRRTEARRTKDAPPMLDLTPIDGEALHAAARREATTTATQLVAMAKSEAALFVHQGELAAELLAGVWAGVQ